MMIDYKFVIVGGRWEGVEGLHWHDDGEHHTPQVILVGTCERGRNCGSSSCGVRVEHVSFWTPDEEERPLRVQRYEKERDEVIRDPDSGALSGKTTYAIGGLLDPRNRGALAHVPAGSPFEPLTYAGALGTPFPHVMCPHVLCPVPPGVDIRAPAAPLHPDYEMRALPGGDHRVTWDPEEDFGAPEEEPVPLVAALFLAAFGLAGALWRRRKGQRPPYVGTLSNTEIDGLEPVTRRT